MKSKRNVSEYATLGIILLLGIVLRGWGSHFGLPHLLARPDEQSLVSISLNLFDGDWNPHFFEYPSLFIYLQFFVYNLFYLFGRLVGYFNDFADFWLLFFQDPGIFFLLPRYLSLAASILTIVVVYQLGRRFDSPLTGLVAAFLAAGTFLLGREAHFGVTDTTLTLLCLSAIYHCLKLVELGRSRDFVFTAIFSGLAASTKYPGFILVIPVVTALILRLRKEDKLKSFFKESRSWLLLSIGLVTFFAVSPYIILDFGKFYQHFMVQLSASTTDAALVPTGFWYHLRFTLRYGMGLPMLLAAIGGLLYGGIRRRPGDLIMLAFVLGFFLLIAPTRRSFVRYLLPLVPLLVLFAAVGLVALTDYFFQDDQKLKLLCVWLAAFVIIAPSSISLVSFDRLMARKDTRVEAAEWIERNIPSASVIAIDGLFYNKLNLTTSPAQTQARFEQIRPGLYSERVGADFSRVFPRPWYYVYPISDLYSTTLEISAESKSTPEEAITLLNMVRQMGAQYLVTSEYQPLPLYTDNWVRLKPVLESNVRLIKQFNPYNPDSKTRPQYDQLDAFYVPYAGFAAIARPGPVVNIYALN